ncbi:MAG: hypothetical protein AAF431_18040 [Pseudomonadota bacterium]
MKIDRKMASYLLEIKRNLPYEMREHFKLSAPNIEELVFDIYQTAKREKLKELAQSFLENSGPEWTRKLQQDDSNGLIGSLDLGKPIRIGEAFNQSAMIVDKMLTAVSRQIAPGKQH